MTAGETVNARKVRHGRDAALRLAKSLDRIVSAKGKKVITLDLKRGDPDDETILAALLGPSGNLRAPALQVGKTLVVGFLPEIYEAEL